MSKRPRTIQIFLPTGDPSGIREAELTTSFIRIIEVPRHSLGEFVKSDDAAQTGLYFLIGGENGDQLYIGQTGSIGARLTRHDKEDEKDWDRALVLVSAKKNSLTPTHLLYMEHIGIAKAKECARFQINNGNAGQKHNTPVGIQADCDEILEVGALLLATLGYPVFEPLVKKETSTHSEKFYCTRSGIKAEAYFTNEGMVVLKGSTGLYKPTGNKPREDILKTRDRLIESGVMRVEGNTTVFNKDHLFKTPSAASCAVIANASNGWTEWKTALGITLSEIHRSQVSPPDSQE